MELSELEQSLGYHFKQQELLLTALTHPSYAGEHHVVHYQRLEFLGDAVLQLTVSRHLFFELPGVPEGQLTRLRASLVREESLNIAAQRFNLGKYIRLSHGEERTGGRKKPSILADIMEAVIAAVYLDGGLESAEALVQRALGDRMHPDFDQDELDAKTKLQELLQSKSMPSPKYTVVDEQGMPHERVFTVELQVNGQTLGFGKGRSKKAAQQQAALQALKALS